jgi:hypothetical protein
MKNFTLILFALTAFKFATAQCPVNISFSKQSEIDNFQANYQGCTEIPGNVVICDNFSGEIKNLVGLRMLKSIGGSLSIGRETMVPGVWCGNSELISLDGLDALESIGGDFSIIQNEMLINLIGLNNLKFIGGVLSIHHNISLSNCEILLICQSWDNPGGDFIIQHNDEGCNSLDEASQSCSFGLDDPLISGYLFALTPNPVADIVVVHAPFPLQYNPELEIYSLDGRLIIQRQISEPETSIDLSGLSKGFYLVRMSGMSEVHTEKIVKQ